LRKDIIGTARTFSVRNQTEPLRTGGRPLENLRSDPADLHSWSGFRERKHARRLPLRQAQIPEFAYRGQAPCGLFLQLLDAGKRERLNGME
jgi:hypothetical protein